MRGLSPNNPNYRQPSHQPPGYADMRMRFAGSTDQYAMLRPRGPQQQQPYLNGTLVQSSKVRAKITDKKHWNSCEMR